MGLCSIILAVDEVATREARCQQRLGLHARDAHGLLEGACSAGGGFVVVSVVFSPLRLSTTSAGLRRVWVVLVGFLSPP